MLRCFLFLCLWSVFSASLAQVYNVVRYTTEDDLIQSQVMTIAQDPRGYLWLGTHRGVVKYDGIRFQNFGRAEGIKGAFVSGILADHSGRVWVATDNGLSVSDGKYYEGEFFRTFTAGEQSLPENDITCLMEDRAGRLWIGSKSKGIVWLKDDVFEREQPSGPQQIQCLMQDRRGRVWVGTPQGLFVNTGPHAYTQLSHPALDRTPVYCLTEDKKGDVWVGTQKGIFRVNPELNVQEGPVLPENTIYCIAEDLADTTIWIGTDKSIIRYHNGAFESLNREYRLHEYQMRSVKIDDEGNIWFGTDGGGFFKVTPGGVFKRYNMEDGLSSNLAKSFLEDEKGRIWISTKDRGVTIMEGGRPVQQISEAGGLGGNDICFTLRDRKGRFWLTSYNGTLTLRENGQFRVFNSAAGLTCNAVYVVAEDLAGNIWAGTDNGIFVQEGERFVRRFSTENGLEENTVYSLRSDRQGRMWVGTAKGLCRIEGDICRSIPGDNAVGANVITLLTDHLGQLWAGSSIGLAVVISDTARRVHISGAPGAHTVVALAEEGGRYLWVGTENGAYRLDLNGFNPASERHTFEHYAQRDGLPSLECNANAAFEDSKGNFWIGTAEGAIMRPSDARRDASGRPPRVYITGVRVAQDTTWEALGYETDTMGLPLKLRLPYSENRLDFEFVGISLKSPQQVEYRFKLEPLDDSFQRPIRETAVTFPKLPPGKYTFTVEAKKESDPWSQAGRAQFTFEIRPPYWQTWWFWLLTGLLLGGMGYVIYAYYDNRRKQQREQQRVRNTAEKLRLEHRALYAMMNPHFTFNALQSIQYFIHRQDKIAANKFLSSFAKLIRMNLESTRSDFISLGEEVERLKLYLSLEKMRFPEKFDYQVIVAPDVDMSGTKFPPMLLQPFVENSIKHGIMSLDEGGIITVQIEPDGEDYLRITIEDNGIGIEASKARKANRPNDHVSQGMQITLDRLDLFARMSGKKYAINIHDVVDAEGKVSGAQVEMVLPMQLSADEKLEAE